MRIPTAAELMLLQSLCRKSRGLLFGLSLVPRQRHPFADDRTSRVVLGFHISCLLVGVTDPGRIAGYQIEEDQLGGIGTYFPPCLYRKLFSLVCSDNSDVG